MNEGPAKVAPAQGAVPSTDIANVRARLAQTEVATGRLRQAGSQEQYLQSYFLVEALENQLETLSRAHRPGRPG